MKKFQFIAAILAALLGWVVHQFFPTPAGWHVLTQAEIESFRQGQEQWREQLAASGQEENYLYYHNAALSQCGSDLCWEAQCDLDGDGKNDRVFFKSNGETEKTRIAATASRLKNKEFSLGEHPHFNGGYGLDAVPAGSYQGIDNQDEPTHIEVRNCGVRLQYYGKSSFLYYYDDLADRFRQIQLTD